MGASELFFKLVTHLAGRGKVEEEYIVGEHIYSERSNELALRGLLERAGEAKRKRDSGFAATVMICEYFGCGGYVRKALCPKAQGI